VKRPCHQAHPAISPKATLRFFFRILPSRFFSLFPRRMSDLYRCTRMFIPSLSDAPEFLISIPLRLTFFLFHSFRHRRDCEMKFLSFDTFTGYMELPPATEMVYPNPPRFVIVPQMCSPKYFAGLLPLLRRPEEDDHAFPILCSTPIPLVICFLDPDAPCKTKFLP